MGPAFFVEPRGIQVGEVRAVIFTIGFGRPADNSDVVRDAASALDAALAVESGGPLALVNGPASLPAMAVIAHRLGHRFDAVAIWDPKLVAYVVAICHGPRFTLGQTLAPPEEDR